MQKYASQVHGVLRIVFGLLLMEHGTQKLFGLPGGTPAVAWMSLLGVAGLLEVLGSALLILGLFTRPVAFVLSGEMAAAYFMMHFPHSMFPVVNKGEPAVMNCFVFLYLAAAGAGAFSLQPLLARRHGTRTEQPVTPVVEGIQQPVGRR